MNELKDKDEQYNAYLKYNDGKPKKPMSFSQLVLIVAIVFIVIGIGLFLFAKYSSNLDFKGFSFLSNTGIDLKERRHGTNMFSRKQNILLLGVDSNGRNADPFKGTRSDTILLISIEPSSKSVNVISVPRDSKVYLSDDNGMQKINAAHALGGIKLTKKTLEETLGVKIDKYIIVNNSIVKQMVDAIDGVPIYIEKNMQYRDKTAGLNINLSKGLHVLNGEQAEGYIRYRHDGLGDIGRTSRQQWFLRGVLERLQTPSAIPKIPEIIKIASENVKTDLSLYEMTQIVAYLRSVDMSKIEVATLPGAPSKKGYISYWILDPEKTQDVINRLVYREKVQPNDKNLVAGIIYSFSQEQKAMAVKKKLKDAGYEVNCIGRIQLPHSQIIGHNSAVTADFIHWLKHKIPEVKGAQFVYDPIKTYCVQSDFTIIISD